MSAFAKKWCADPACGHAMALHTERGCPLCECKAYHATPPPSPARSARYEAEDVAEKLHDAMVALRSLGNCVVLSPGTRAELFEAAEHIRRQWCDDQRLAHASGLLCEVNAELERAEAPVVEVAP